MGKAIRDIYGESLVKYGAENKDVVVLDADVSGSTKSGFFGAAFPDRFFNVGIAEANMNAMACGFASAGKIPFTNTFATFISSNGLLSLRALASYSKLNVKVMGGYSGLSDAYDGPTHHSLDDVAVFNALPNFKVFVASDEYVTDYLVKNCIETYGPMYVRLSREALPALYDQNTVFEEGKGKVVKEGSDVTVIACGVMVSKAMEAMEALKTEGISVCVVDMFTIKPLDVDLIKACAARTGAIVIAEEHSIYGGLCSVTAEALVLHGISIPTEFVAMQDTHAETGAYSLLLEKYGLGSSAVIDAVKKVISMK